MHDQRFTREHRIRRASDFQRAYRRRCTAGDRLLLVFAHRNGLPHARVGLSVSRKVGGAVQRNRWKRLLREAFRLERASLPAGVDLVVVPRPDAEPNLPVLRQSLSTLAHRAAKKLAGARKTGGVSSAVGTKSDRDRGRTHGP